MSDTLEETIDGVPITKQVVKKRKDAACAQCDFPQWAPGDTCYIFEHWMDDDSSHGAREHLCPRCAVERGLDYDKYFKKNKNDTKSPEEDLELRRRSAGHLNEDKRSSEAEIVSNY
jgi:hypothetical protein